MVKPPFPVIIFIYLTGINESLLLSLGSQLLSLPCIMKHDTHFIWYTEYVCRSCGQSRTRWVVARPHLRTATGLPLCTRVTTARVETLTDVSCTNRWSRTWIVRRQLVCTFSPSGACMFGLWGGRDLLWRVSWSLWWVRHFGNGVVVTIELLS